MGSIPFLKEPDTTTMIIVDVHITRVKVPVNLSYEQRRDYAHLNKPHRLESKIHSRALDQDETYDIKVTNNY